MNTMGTVWINKKARARFSVIGYIMLMIVVVMAAVGTMLSYFLNRFDLWGHKNLVSFLSLFPIYLTGVPLAIFFFGMMDSVKIPEQRLPARVLIEVFLICLPVMIGGNLIGNFISTFFSDGQAVSPVEEALENVGWIDIFTIVILGPIAEEILCRKMIIDHTVRYGEKTALVFSALCFALLHRNFFQFFYAFGLGLIFGYVYLRSGRLRYTICYHILINFMGGVIAPALLKLMDYDKLMEAMNSGDLEALQALQTENNVGTAIVSAYTTAMGIGMLAGVAFLILRWRRIHFYRLPEELPRGTVLCTAYLNSGVVLFTGACAVLMALALYT